MTADSAFLDSAISVSEPTNSVTAGAIFFLAMSIIVSASMLICLQ